MSRGVDPSLLSALAEPVVRPAYLLRLGFAEPVNLWTGRREIEALGHTFQPASGAMDITPIEETLDGAQPQATITLENIDPSEALAPQSGEGIGWTTQVVNYSGVDQIITAPPGATELKIHAWGAGGGPDGYEGGIGGYSFAHISTAGGNTYAAVVGQGGVDLTTVYGFGGTGQGVAHQHNGGGLTGLFSGLLTVVDTSYDRAIVVAGGGGAAGYNGSTGRSGANAHDVDSGGMSTMQGHAGTGTVNSGEGGGGAGYRGGGYHAPYIGNLYGIGGTGYAVNGLSAPQVLGTPWPGGEVPGPKHEGYDGLAGKSQQHGQMILEWKVPIPSTAEAVSAEFYLGATTMDGELIGTPQLLFSGTVDAIGWDYGPQTITAVIDLIGAPPIVEATTGQRYTAEGQRRKYPTDLGLDYVADLQTLALQWGGNAT